jgi:hypothetical protein
MFQGALDVELHAAREKVLWIEAAEQQVRVGDGKLVSFAITDGAWIGAGTVGPNAQ